MENKSEQEVLREIGAIIFPLAGKPDILCSAHQGEKAALICSKCSAGICWECLKKSENPADMLCPDCFAEAQAGLSFLKYLKVLRFPAIWVLVCIAIAGISYGLGIGNPNLEAMQIKDKNDPWYRKDAGTILLAQASRERQRAAALFELNRELEARKWSLLAAGSFAKSAEYWQGTPAVVNLKIAEALMLADGGDVDAALALFENISIDRNDQIFPAVQYHSGRLYLLKGDNKKADDFFQQAWKNRPGVGSDFDAVLFETANNPKEAEMMGKIRLICDTKWTPQMADFCQKRLKVRDDSFGIVSPDIMKIAEEIKKPDKKEKENKPEKQTDPDFEIEFVK